MTPREAKAISRLASLRRGKKQVKRAAWPGRDDVFFDLAVLSCSEVQECHAEAVKRFAALKVPIDTYFMSLFQDELMTQLLYRAMRDPDDETHERLFAEDVDDLRDNTEVDERAELFALYEDFRILVDPDFDKELSSSERGAILEALGKKDASALRAIGSAALASFMLTTVSPPST
jgi:hypothetical protein